MNGQEYRTQEMRDLGFRCVTDTSVSLPNGDEVKIKATSFQQSKVRANDSQRQRRAFKIYTITYSDGTKEAIDELTLEDRIGIEAFNNLPA